MAQVLERRLARGLGGERPAVVVVGERAVQSASVARRVVTLKRP